jgi:hypothetical protein
MPVNEVVVKGFFPPFFCGHGCKGLAQQCAVTWGLRDTARGRGSTINVPVVSMGRLSLRTTSY